MPFEVPTQESPAATPRAPFASPGTEASRRSREIN
jgi:hypothetical protein